MRQPTLLALLLLLAAASAHAATVYVTTTCTSTSTTTITHISASSTQIFTSAIPVVETPVAPSSSSAPSASTILVPLSSSAPSSSAGSSLLYTNEAAPFPTAAGTGASAPAGTGTGAASGTGAPISPAVPYKGAAARCHTGGLFGGGGVAVAIGAVVALALC